MSESQRKFLTNDEEMYAIGVHSSHVDVSWNVRTAVTNAQWRAFVQTHSLLFGPPFLKGICSFSMKKSLFYFMLSAITYERDGTKYQYYQYIPYLLINKQLVRMVCLFWDGGGGGGAKLFHRFCQEKFREHNFCLETNLILIVHKFFMEGKFCQWGKQE